MSTENTVQKKKDLIVFFGLIIVVIAMVAIVLVAGTSNDKPQESKADNSSNDTIPKDNPTSVEEAVADTENESMQDSGKQNTETEQVSTPTKALPKLIDLGSTRCKPCIAMEPVLEALKNEYSDFFEVQFININENREEAEKYNIRLIPTQIFFDAGGKELFRHVGFYSKEEIIIKWSELGIKLVK